MMTKTAHPFRRTAVMSLVAMVATVLTLVVPWADAAEDDFVAGSGRSRASIVRVGPSAAQLSLAPSVGVSLSDYINTLGRGNAFIFDYAALDATMNDTGRDVKTEFPELRVESRFEGSEQGVRWEPKPGFIETAQATDAPVGRASVQIEGFSIPGIVEVTGGQSRSFSGVYRKPGGAEDELIRAAGGTVDIPRVKLLGGMVVMHDLRWEIAQITDENDDDKPEAIGAFRVGRLVIQGETAGEGLGQDELEAALGQIRDGLAQGGIHLQLPTVGLNGEVAQATPLGIRLAAGIIPEQLADGIQDLRGPLAEQFITQCQAAEGGDEEEEAPEEEGEGGGGTGLPLGRVDSGYGAAGSGAVHGSHDGIHEEFDEFSNDGPGGVNQDPDYTPPDASGGSDCGVPFLVADLALAPVSGFGQLDVQLGGASGVTEGTVFEGFCFGCKFGFDSEGGGFGSVTDDTSTTAGGSTKVAGVRAVNPDTGEAVDTTAPPSNGTPPAQVATGSNIPQPFKLTGSRASAAWAIGLLGLLAALGMATTDYRRLRARRRIITPIS